MPDPLLYLKAVLAAAMASTLFVLAVFVTRRIAKFSNNETWLNWTAVLSLGFGFTVGYYVISLRLAWPPASALDRHLTLVIPVALAMELIAGFQRIPRWFAWMLRVSLAVAVPRVLLHGSVYLAGAEGEWSLWQSSIILAGCGALLVLVWGLLAWLSQRSAGISISLALQLTILCAGLTVMMEGYIKGGAAAFPMAAALVATTMICKLVTSQIGAFSFDSSATIGIGVVGLFGLLFIGRFFGQLSSASSLAMMLSPLLCWVTEVPLIRRQQPWMVGTLRLTCVACVLLVVLVFAKRNFDRDMAPLLVELNEVTAVHPAECTQPVTSPTADRFRRTFK
jgi:hypothetical protein